MLRLLLALLLAPILALLAAAAFLFGGWLQYRRLEKSVVEKMDQYYLQIAAPGREEYVLQEDELFETPYMASRLSVSAVPTRIYDRRERLVGEYVAEKGIYVRDPGELPASLKRALVASEDGGFYEHRGVRWRALARALWINARSLRVRQGGSTITQQLAKILFTTRRKSYGRKLFEIFCARKLESKFTKEQILLMYLNYAYFGHGCYGIECAARLYFGRPPGELGPAESALLVGLLPSPDNYSPFRNPALAKARHRAVLRRMAGLGSVPGPSAERAWLDFWAGRSFAASPPEASFWRMSVNKAPYFVELVRRELAQRFPKDRVLKGGLKVRTSLDLELQEAAASALREGLESLNRRLRREEAGRKDPLEGALAAVDPSDGGVLALVGGGGFNFQNQLVRATDISRPIGSSVKPFIYAAAFESGSFKPQDEFEDKPATYRLARGRRWTPRNYGERYYGRVSLAAALRSSLNSVAVQLLSRLDLERVVRLLSEASGVEPEAFPRGLSLALGAADLSPLQLACAFAVFANGGHRVEPWLLRAIEDRDGRTIYERPLTEGATAQILDPGAARLTRDVLRGVLSEEDGTAHAAVRAEGFSIPAAGKTGTTNDYRDAWFTGATPELSASVWLGYDDMRIPLGPGRSGGQVAAPVWLRFVKGAYRDRPARDFE